MSTLSSVRANVREISKIEEEALRTRSVGERLGDVVAFQSGRMWFIGFHVLWFFGWILLNSGRTPRLRPFDPFPYPFLTMVVSLESIFLSLFILMSQNRATRQADQRAHLDLQINLLAEHETTKTLQLLKVLCQHHGIDCQNDPALNELLSTTKPAEIIRELRDVLPTESQGAAESVADKQRKSPSN